MWKCIEITQVWRTDGQANSYVPYKFAGGDQKNKQMGIRLGTPCYDQGVNMTVFPSTITPDLNGLVSMWVGCEEMTWCQSGTKPLWKPMLTQFKESYAYDIQPQWVHWFCFRGGLDHVMGYIIIYYFLLTNILRTWKFGITGLLQKLRWLHSDCR